MFLIRLFVVIILIWMRKSSPGTAKSRNTEARLNAVMPRIPNPQPNPGGATNSSYGFSNGVGHAGNSAYKVSTSWNSVASPGDNGGVTSGQIGGAPGHYHNMSHGHYYGNAAADFNTFVDSTTNAINEHNNNMDWIAGPLIQALNVLQGDHSALMAAHNDIVNRLANANILH
jgi:hypothetical protein